MRFSNAKFDILDRPTSPDLVFSDRDINNHIPSKGQVVLASKPFSTFQHLNFKQSNTLKSNSEDNNHYDFDERESLMNESEA